MAAFIPEELARILAGTPELQRALLVGGCVRDWLLGLPIKDFDIEVYGVTCEQLSAALARWGRTDLVGRSFGVIKLTTGSGLNYDFAVPRRDSKIGPGHKGFEITFDPDITPRQACARRDFTINALAYEPRRGEVLDFFGGEADLRARVLRHTGPAFVEDPLRVLRGMQLAARFDLRAAPETVELCRSIKPTHAELAVERVWQEWLKWATRSTAPSAGLRFLAQTEWIDHYPEIKALQGVPQDPEWHPEGDVFVHTGHCCDALVRLPEWQAADEATRCVYSLAILAHDFGKPATTHTAERDGRMRIVSPGHEEAGAPLAERFLGRIDAPRAIRERVIPLVVHHLAHLNPITDRSVRRLARRLAPETIRSLCVIIAADHMGRPPRTPEVPEAARALAARAAELDLQARAPQPILKGRHLLELGLVPGPDFSVILDEAFEAQLEGRFASLPEAWRWLSEQARLPLSAEARRRLAARVAEGVAGGGA